MGQLTLLLGGARSGKSTYAERLAKKNGGNVLYIATAEALDPEMKDRIQKHQAQRPEQWTTRELPHRVTADLEDTPPQADIVLLDCMTLLVSNAILSVTEDIDQPDENLAYQVVEEELDALLAYIEKHAQNWIIVTNEVGLGLVPPYPLGRAYRDILGWANRRLASAAEEVYFLTAGMILPLHELAERLD
jgi:adenosylcobinamide kinase/adenosylcobinamide-phosphate guanylyltransferase